MIRFDVADRMMLYSLDCLVLCYQEQRTRGFAAYEAMRGVTFSLRKKFIRVSPPIASPDLSSGKRLPAEVFTCLCVLLHNSGNKFAIFFNASNGVP